jgi:hypothetical protein
VAALASESLACDGRICPNFRRVVLFFNEKNEEYP